MIKLKKIIWNSVNTMLASMVMCFLLLAMTGGLLKNDFGLIILQILMMLIFLGLPYLHLKKTGQQDRCLVKSGKGQENLLTGIKASIVCFIVLEISVVLLIFMRIGILPDRLYIYRICNPQFIGFAHFIAPDLNVAALSWRKIIFFALLPFLYPLTMEVGYLAGYKGASLS